MELSPTLIARAIEREEADPLGITYLVADAADLPMFSDGSFSRVTAHMVLMNAEDAGGILNEVGRLLEPGGASWRRCRPCFEVPGHSEWEVELDGEERIVRRIWGYRESFSCPDYLNRDQPQPIMRYHRPLSWYMAHLREAGILIDALEEPVGDAIFADQKPRAQR